MPKTVEYYLTPSSPWVYLGHRRFADIAARNGATIAFIPVDLAKVFPVSGGLPLPQRAPQRLAYRLAELKRWRDFLGMALNVQPKFHPVDSDRAVRFLTAARERRDDAMALAEALLAACWAEEHNIADTSVLLACAAAVGMNGDALRAAADSEEIRRIAQADFDRAVARGVFGAPTYVVDDELFWGQDRLDFVERALAA